MPNPTLQELKDLAAKLNDAISHYDESETPEGSLSRAEIRGVAREITNAVTDEMEKSWEHVLHMTELVAIRIFIKLGVFQHIPLEGSISRADLAKAVNATEQLIERPSRVLVGTGMLDQTASGEYKHTRFSKTYVKSSINPAGIFFHAIYEVYLRTTTRLDEFMEEKHQLDPSEPYDLPASIKSNPLVWHYGRDGDSTWDVLASVPEVMNVFHTALKFMDQMIPPTGSYIDFSRFATSGSSTTNGVHDESSNQVEIVDVGGGNGTVLANIIKATPTLDPKKCVLQDVEEVLALADAARDLGVQTMTIDFHREQPVKGAKAYYTRFITHDYSDAGAINILTHIAQAMSPSSTLLVAEALIPDRLSEVSLPAGTLDALMWCIGGKERTEEGFRKIFDGAGLELVGVNTIPGSAGGVLEVRLKR